MTISELKKLLLQNDCTFDRHGKRHDIWYSKNTGKYIPIPRHKKEIPTGTCKNILKDAGLE